MTQFSHIKPSDEYQPLWQAIADNRIEEAGFFIKPYKAAASKPHSGKVFPAPLEIAGVILSGQTRLPDPKLNAVTGGDAQFAELVRLFMALEQNGRYAAARPDFVDLLLEITEDLAGQMQEAAGDYPNTSIKANVWMAGAVIREWCGVLADRFLVTGDKDARYSVLYDKCSITTAIMSHYPHSVGPDMVAVGMAMEDIGMAEESVKFYNAVISDMGPMAEDLTTVPAEEIMATDITMLEALKTAYERVTVLTATKQYQDMISIVVPMIERGPGPEPQDEQ
ncbi:hypothetical protein [uncultured Chitinophaga sp.]|uniref:hypothetical protein n=1 Tax=uncultured Chitinophaga sp. TaxID=339340 RepID=UPI0025F0CBFA|nr:hypothetical protein [uncultured Chitinophaga sp.]